MDLTASVDWSKINKRTKIVASLGPASSSVEVLQQLLKAGVNMCRLNFSFGDHEAMRKYVANVHEASKLSHIPVSILGDLQGPKFRINDFEDPAGIKLVKSKVIKFAYSKDKKGNTEIITCPHDTIVRDLKVDDRILLYDGTMELKVMKRISTTEIECEIVTGGNLLGKKGINLPQLKIQVQDLSEKDKRDALLLLDLQVDYIGLSFVQSAQDVIRAREFLKNNLKPNQKLPALISKIEKPQALEDIDAIIRETDGIMVARGDLGVELSLEMVPVAQKMLIRKANEAGKPVITATQMLSSMEQNEAPTRAEVSDIANAVMDGTDATMTSAETSMSPHPVLVIETMSKVLKTTEYYLPSPEKRVPFPELRSSLSVEADPESLRLAVANAAFQAAQSAKAKAIIVFSQSGEMAKVLSKARPQCMVISFTPKEQGHLINQLRLYYAVVPFEVEYAKYTDTTIAKAEEMILSAGLLTVGDWVVLCGGNQLALAGLSNMTKIYKLGEFLRVLVNKFQKK